MKAQGLVQEVGNSTAYYLFSLSLSSNDLSGAAWLVVLEYLDGFESCKISVINW